MKLNELLPLFDHKIEDAKIDSGESCSKVTLTKGNRNIIFYYLNDRYFGVQYKRFDRVIELDTIEEALKYFREEDPPFHL